MNCSSCGNNSLTSCGCSDNCPNQSSEINFDGVLNNINVPAGSNINVVFALLEEYIITTISGLDLSYEVLPGNCLGLPVGVFGYDQMFDALSVALCALNIEVDGLADALAAFEITINNQILDIQNDITDIQTDITNINIALTDNMPIGSMMMYPTAIVPNSKWNICEGQTLATALYPDLFSVVGYSFGGAGAFFSLPDMRSKFIVGYDAIAAPEYQIIGQGGGQDSVTITSSESGLRPHSHTASFSGSSLPIHSHGIWADPGDGVGSGAIDLTPESGSPYYDGANGGGYSGSGLYIEPVSAGTPAGSVTVNSVAALDALDAHENRPSFVVFPWMIKVLN